MATNEEGANAERAKVTCSHCGRRFSLPRHRRGTTENGPRPTLVKCPHCHWKFEVAEEGNGDSPRGPVPGRFSL